MDRPITTLFMLSSLDGKISTGAVDVLDVDRDFPTIPGIREGLHQYYEIEQTTDLWSLNTGRVQAKMGINHKPFPKKSPVSFVLVDSQHLSEHGVRYFCALSQTFVLITTNDQHPAFSVNEGNLHIILQKELSLADALSKQHGITINKAKLVMEEPIKACGGYKIKAKLGYEIVGTVSVMVAEA